MQNTLKQKPKYILQLFIYWFFVFDCKSCFQVIEGLKVGNVALKKANELLNIEQIEQILDETKEGIDKQKVNLFTVFTCDQNNNVNLTFNC